MKDLRFNPRSASEIRNKEKTCSVRFGTKYVGQFELGEIIQLYIDIKPLAQVKVTAIETKKISEITEEDLAGHSSYAKTPDTLKLTLNGYYGRQLGRKVNDEDTVTIIRWEYQEESKKPSE